MRQTLAVVLGALILAVPALAQQAGMPAHMKGKAPGGMMNHAMGGPMMGHGMMESGLMPLLMQNADELKLSDEQVGKLHRIRMRHMATSQDLMATAHKSKAEAMAALGNPAADEASIRASAKTHVDAVNKIVDDELAERSEMLAVLTAEQKAKLKTLKVPDMPCEDCPAR
jgi:Spy/CpxP family protein refolding chaperone